jgi:hypothetical protein
MPNRSLAASRAPEEAAIEERNEGLAKELAALLDDVEETVTAEDVVDAWNRLKEQSLKSGEYPESAFDFAGFSAVVSVLDDDGSIYSDAAQDAAKDWYEAD